MAPQSQNKHPGLAPPGSDQAIRNALAILESKLGELKKAIAYEEAALTRVLDIQINGGYESPAATGEAEDASPNGWSWTAGSEGGGE